MRHTVPWRRVLSAAWAVLSLTAAGAAFGASPVDLDQALREAESAKTADNVRFAALLRRLGEARASLSPPQQWHLRYLQAWQAAYRGDYGRAEPLLEGVIEGAGELGLRARAEATLVNILGIGRHYEEAYARLDHLIDALPRLTDPGTRLQVLAEASQVYLDAGQYTLATSYAEQLLGENPTGRDACKGQYLVLHARFKSQASPPLEPFFNGVALCVAASEDLFANGIRADIARIYLKQRRASAAVSLLGRYRDEVLATRYQTFIAEFDSLLAQAHWQSGDAKRARQFALASVAASIKGEYTEPLIGAYEVLYETERQQGRMATALAYHEKYMAADKAHLDDVSAKALAYQMVRQQVQARKTQVDALARRNQILQLEQALDRKKVEAGRLYIALLLLGLLAVGLWLLRLKRSQLRFMRMAQCDGLTGIYNRKHFMGEAEHALRHAEKSGRVVSLVLIDLDHFKLTNDTYGHATGDQVLRRTVQACQEKVRPTDVFGRLGGEEFGVLLPECALDTGIERAEALRRAIAALGGKADPGVPVSASFGVACTGDSGYELRQLLVDADQALYRAKRAGRNCVVAGRPGESLAVA